MGFYDGPQIGNVIDQEPGGEGFYSGGPAYQEVDPVVIENFRDEAAASATASAASASAAASSASTATTEAGIATTQAGTATTEAGIATTQAGNAASSASAASASASAASTSETNAHTSELNAASSASAAAGSASSASTSATSASSSASAASTSETNAHTSELNAASSASAAATSATNAATAVQAAAGTATPLIDGVAAVGSSTKWAHEDHKHPTDTTRAPLASPAFSGVPTVPTPGVGDNSTTIANTAWVLANAAGGVPATATPLVDSGSGAVGTATKYAREDHAHPTDTSRAPYDAMAFNNLIINGGFEVDQANAGASIGVNTNNFGADCWVSDCNTSSTAVCTGQQVADAPPGFSNSWKVTVTTAQATVGSTSDQCRLQQRFEGYRTSVLAYGTSGAQPSVLGFWAKTSPAGLYSGALRNFAGTRSFPFTFTTTSAGVWQFFTVSIPGDTATSGTPWPVTTNGISHQLFFSFALNPAQCSSTSGAWVTGNYMGVTGTTNGWATVGNTFQIAGVSWVAGTEIPTATRSPLLKLPFAETLRLCQRYYEKSYDYGTVPGTATEVGCVCGIYNINAASQSVTFSYAVTKRATPTLTMYDGIAGTTGVRDTAVGNKAATTTTGLHGGSFGATGASAGDHLRAQFVADARL